MLNQMGWGKRILISRRDTRSSPVDYAAAGTPWDEMCEIYPDDFAALAGLGAPTLVEGPKSPYRPTKRVGVSVVVTNQEGHCLMHRRLPGASCDAGLYGVPGGHLECGETILGAAVREFHEETGCELFGAAINGVVEIEDWISFIVGGAYVGTPVRPESERYKAEEWEWLPLSRIVELSQQEGLQSGLVAWFSGRVLAWGGSSAGRSRLPC
jgi:ADP-ribose pyrophosphatase YjhB (NUDIX family)